MSRPSHRHVWLRPARAHLRPCQAACKAACQAACQAAHTVALLAGLSIVSLAAGTPRARAQAAAAPSEAMTVQGRLLVADMQSPGTLVLVAEPTDRRSAPAFAKIGPDGHFQLIAIEPGTYRVTLVNAPFGLRLVETTLTLPADGAPLILRWDRGTATLRGLGGEEAVGSLPADALTGLPVPDDRWEQLPEVLPGVNDTAWSDDQSGSGGGGLIASRRPAASAGLSDTGLSPLWNAESLDGLPATQSFRGGARGASLGGPRSTTTFARSAIRSIEAAGAGGVAQFSAQRGGAGLNLAVASHAPAARLHGSAFLRAQASAFAATNPFALATSYRDGVVTTAVVKPDDQQQLLGGTLDVPLPAASLGPAGRWSSAVFLSEEAERRTQEVIATPVSGDFFGLSAMQRALLANRGVTPTAINGALDYLSGLGGPLTLRQPRALTFGRLDAASSRAGRLSLGYSRQRFRSPSGPGLGTRAEGILNRGRGSFGEAIIHVDAGTARWTHGLWRGSVLEVRVGLSRDLEAEMPAAPLPAEPAIAAGGLAPQVLISPDGFGYGTPAALGRSAYPDEARFDSAGTLTTRLGSRQVLTLGGGWSRTDDRIDNGQTTAGAFSYDSGLTNGRAGGLVDWITDYTFNVHAYPNGGCPSINAAVHDFCFTSFRQSFAAPQSEFFTHDSAGFVEDSVRLPGNLRLTVGARYDYTLLPLPVAPNPTLDAQLRALQLDAATTSGANGGLTSSFPEDRNNVGPRLALAWSPGPRWFTLHAGYGAFYGHITGATINTAFAGTSLTTATRTVRITPTTETACPQVANQGFGFPCVFTAYPVGVAAASSTSQSYLFSSRFRLPAIQRASLELERPFGRRVHLRAAYAVSLAAQLPNSVDLNIAPATGVAAFVIGGGAGQPGLRPGETFQVPSYGARLLPAFGPVTAITSHANAATQMGTATASWHGPQGIALDASYTLLRSLDTNPRLGPAPVRATQFDPFAIGYDKGRSSLDFTHRFAGTLSLHTRLEHGPRPIRQAGSGWELAAVGTAGSGAPYSYGVYGGTELNGGRESLNGSGGATWLPTVGRNTLRLPPRGRVDLRLARAVPVYRGLHLRLEAAAFNLLNTAPVSRVETRAFLPGDAPAGGGPTPLVFQDPATVLAEGIATPAFGTPLSSTTALSRERRVELGVHLSF